MKTFFSRCVALSGLFVILLSYNSSGQTDRFNLDSIRTLVRQLSSDSEKVKTMIDLAKVIYCEDSTNKVVIATEAKKLAENIKWNKGIYDANMALGIIYFSCLKNYPKAFDAWEDNVRLAQKRRDTLNEAKANITIAKYYIKRSQYQQSLEYFSRALVVHPNADLEMGIHGDMGVVFNLIGDYSNALTSYNNSLNILDSITRSKTKGDVEDTQQRAGLLLNIGDLYLATLKPDKAFEEYDLALTLGAAINDRGFQIRSYTGMGKTWRLKSDYQRAIDDFGIALKICDSVNEFVEEVKILNELANTYLESYAFSMALTFADSARRLAEVQSYIDLLPKSYNTLGNIYMKQNKYDLAIPYLEKGLNISLKTGVLEDQGAAWYALYSAYDHTGEPVKALEAFKNFTSIRDSISNISKTNELIRKEIEIEFRQTKLADSLRTQSVYDKKIEHQKAFTVASFIGLLLVLLLTFFIFRNYNIQKKYNELLSREKKSHLAHIEAQSNVLSDIAHIQAHQVRGPVATILGLVQLFNYEDPSDPVNKEVMEGLGTVTEKLDTVVKEVILKENRLRYGKDQ